MRFRTIILLLVSVLAVSCSEYEKLLKSTDYDLKYTKLKEYYDQGKYAKASELINQVIPVYRATEKAEELTWMNAQCYLNMRDYMLAGVEFKNYADMYLYGKHIEEAVFMSGMCKYYLSPRPELDQDYTLQAIEDFQIFIGRFPSSPRVTDAARYIDELSEKLAQKAFLSAKLYYNMKQYKAAVVSLENCLNKYPASKYREEMMYMKLNSLFLYAENSVVSKQTERYQEVLDNYFSFIEEFPKTVYAREVATIFQTVNKKLKLESVNQ
ncbi:MAG TPA: outer membrane protein assembly factor BamD [Bacteroidales bacterium]|nr:outer membrane protein assembly factor BamD [Bacteroidales bacterium]HRR92832.1 outer membrane protein assembly factor BamD [Bacteroidales bacterium]HRT89896.1 outer membrane protein assembly factor BamD [Bacteroidales bacterium]